MVFDVVLFTAPWCAPCKPVAAILDELAPRFPGARFRTVNLDDEPEAGARYGVLALPTVVVARDGVALTTLDGARGRAEYECALAEVLPAA